MAGSQAHPMPAARSRKILRIVSLALLMLAAIPCLLRISWIRIDSTGYRQATFEYGCLAVNFTPQTVPGAPTQNILNRQIEIGFRPRLRWKRLVPLPGYFFEVPVSLVLGGAGVVLFALSLRRRHAPGYCLCGYPLAGLTGSVCPECGRNAPSGAPGGPPTA
ncbi:MAG: hypothetical protein KF745_12155 [Phycisphaeraceae bacterium]|nr:hypothetical protein [Phycisphaeraceae bacterium]